MDNPGQPLNSAQLAGNQGIPMSGFTIPNHMLHPGTGSYALEQATSFAFPVDKAVYSVQNVPFMPVRTDYKP